MKKKTPFLNPISEMIKGTNVRVQYESKIFKATCEAFHVVPKSGPQFNGMCFLFLKGYLLRNSDN